MLITSKILQSAGIFTIFRIMATKGSKDNPNPSLIRFLSRKFSEFLAIELTVNPRPKV